MLAIEKAERMIRMRGFNRIFKAEIYNTIKGLWTTLIISVALYIYFRLLLGVSINFIFLLTYLQAVLIYKLAVADGNVQISKYLSLGCTRKNVFKVIWIRWCLLFVILTAVMVVGSFLLSDDVVFNGKMIWTQISTYFLIVGLGTFSSVATSYSKNAGIVAGVVFGFLIGVGVFILMEVSQSSDTLKKVIGYLNDITLTYTLIVGVIAFVISFFVQKIQMRKYAVK